MSNGKVVITNGEESKTVDIKDSGTDALLDAFDGCWVLSNLGDDETESLEWRLVMAEHHNKRLSHENEALHEALRLKEAKCETLASDVSRIVSAAADAYLSGSEQQHVDHLYRVIHDASGRLYSKDEEGSDENSSL